MFFTLCIIWILLGIKSIDLIIKKGEKPLLIQDLEGVIVLLWFGLSVLMLIFLIIEVLTNTKQIDITILPFLLLIVIVWIIKKRKIKLH